MLLVASLLALLVLSLALFIVVLTAFSSDFSENVMYKTRHFWLGAIYKNVHNLNCLLRPSNEPLFPLLHCQGYLSKLK